MKKFVSGFLAGSMIFGTVCAFAVQYAANPVDFKVLVNGKEFISDPPALEVEGRTYLPLRAIGDALGVPVSWNEELRQAEVGNASNSASSNEYSRNNPAPINVVQTHTKKSIFGSVTENNVSVRVLEVKRGAEAEKVLKENMIYSSLTAPQEEEGYEYLIAKVALSVLNVADDGAFDVNDYYFKAFSSNNEEMPDTKYDYYFDLKPKLTGSLYAGGNIEGWLTLLVKKDDPAPKLAYNLDYEGKNGIWFKLYE